MGYPKDGLSQRMTILKIRGDLPERILPRDSTGRILPRDLTEGILPTFTFPFTKILIIAGRYFPSMFGLIFYQVLPRFLPRHTRVFTKNGRDFYQDFYQDFHQVLPRYSRDFYRDGLIFRGFLSIRVFTEFYPTFYQQGPFFHHLRTA